MSNLYVKVCCDYVAGLYGYVSTIFKFDNCIHKSA